MKQITTTERKMAAALLFSSLLLLIAGCTKGDADEVPNKREEKKAIVSADGTTISLPAGSEGLHQIETSIVKKGRAMLSVIAPARVVATISTSLSTNDKFILFDSPDVTTLYSQYRQSKVNVTRTAKNLERMRDVYANQGATAKDLNEAETEAVNARSAVAELEGRLRTLGFNPMELDNTSAGIIWLISDVTETQLHEVQKGEDVDVYFSAFPEKKFIGTAEAIGDVVDPVTRTVKVRVTMHNYRDKFLPGMFARVDFGDPTDGVLLLPLSSLVTVDGKDYAFVEVEPRTYQRRQVTIGNSTPSTAVIMDGINDGERVVTLGAMLLKGLSFGF